MGYSVVIQKIHNVRKNARKKVYDLKTRFQFRPARAFP